MSRLTRLIEHLERRRDRYIAIALALLAVVLIVLTYVLQEERGYGSAVDNRIGAVDYQADTLITPSHQIEVSVAWTRDRPQDASVTLTLRQPQFSDLSLALPNDVEVNVGSLGLLGDDNFLKGFKSVPNFDERFVDPFRKGLDLSRLGPPGLDGASISCVQPFVPVPTPDADIEGNVDAGFRCIVRHSTKPSSITVTFSWPGAVRSLSFEKRAVAIALYGNLNRGTFEPPSKIQVLVHDDVELVNPPGNVDHDLSTGYPALRAAWNPGQQVLQVEWVDRSASAMKGLLLVALPLLAGFLLGVLGAKFRWRS